MRLNKYLQQAGIGSRREAERLIEAGVVTVNGQRATVTTEVPETGATVTVNGQPVAPQGAAQPRVFCYHKPTGVIVTARDHEGRETLYEALAQLPQSQQLPRLMPVGRLDLNSEGLLLLTDSGPLAESLMHPRNNLGRTYRVRVLGQLNAKQLAQWQAGLTISTTSYRGATLKHVGASQSGKNHTYEVTLTEGKNREIRRIFEHFGCQVNRLIRTTYGPFELGDLPKRGLVEVPPAQVASLMKSLT
jgi:23S rRNA pseudouridine2605 synthase